MDSRPWHNVDTSYKSVSTTSDDKYDGVTGQPGDDLKRSTSFRPYEQRSWLKTLGMQSVAALWLAPIITLLWLNASGFVIGQSAWCPGRDSCNNGTYYLDPALSYANRLKYTKQDNDLLGALQLVAKALEMWFNILALWLVYLVTMRIANADHGLPVEYLTRAYRLAELWENFRPRLWTSVFGSKSGPARTSGTKIQLAAFVVLTALVSILCAMMGPATAILALPSQQWLDAKGFVAERFDTWNSGQPPIASGYLFQKSGDNCDGTDIANSRWSCLYSTFGSKLDTWLVSTQLALDGLQFNEALLSFTSNASSDNTEWEGISPHWIPPRQLLNNITIDMTYYQAVQGGAKGVDGLNTYGGFGDLISPALSTEYEVWRQALQLESTRIGPILGMVTNVWPPPKDYWNNELSPTNQTGQGARWTTIVDDDRQVTCYPYWAYQSPYWEYYYGDLNNYTRCAQRGSGWGANTKEQFFSFQPPLSNTTTNSSISDAGIAVYSSDRTAFLPNGTLPNSFDPACLTNGIVPSGIDCDWDTFFTPNENLITFNMSQFSNTIEIRVPGTTSDIFAFDYTVYANFTKYIFRPSFLTDLFQSVGTTDLPSSGEAVHVDPNWYLATWSVDAAGIVPSNRSTTLQNSIMTQTPGLANFTHVDFGEFTFLQAVVRTGIQYMLTIIDYQAEWIPDSRAISNKEIEAERYGLNPYLTLHTRYYTWAYGLSSKTNRFGVAIVAAGAAVAILSIVLVGVDRREYRSMTDMIVAALMHKPQGEFESHDGSAKEISKVRLKVKQTEHVAPSFVFEGVSFSDERMKGSIA